MRKSALLIIDVQNDMFQETNPIYNGANLIDNLKHLIKKARTSDIPIFYIQHNEPVGEPLENGSVGWEIHPEIAPSETDSTIQKETPDSFFNTNLDDELKKHEITHLVLAGIQSEICVDTTCRRAFSMNYKVTLVGDTHSTWDSKNLTAQQIIDHHNQTLGWFANVKDARSIEFR